jgi:hypothetical protein
MLLPPPPPPQQQQQQQQQQRYDRMGREDFCRLAEISESFKK